MLRRAVAPVPACSQRLSSRAVSTALCLRLIYAWSVTRPHRLYLSHHKTALDEHRLIDRYSVGEAPWLFSVPGHWQLNGRAKEGWRRKPSPGCDSWPVMGHLATVRFFRKPMTAMGSPQSFQNICLPPLRCECVLGSRLDSQLSLMWSCKCAQAEHN